MEVTHSDMHISMQYIFVTQYVKRIGYHKQEKKNGKTHIATCVDDD
jgi:hypothetical protein